MSLFSYSSRATQKACENSALLASVRVLFQCEVDRWPHRSNSLHFSLISARTKSARVSFDAEKNSTQHSVVWFVVFILLFKPYSKNWLKNYNFATDRRTWLNFQIWTTLCCVEIFSASNETLTDFVRAEMRDKCKLFELCGRLSNSHWNNTLTGARRTGFSHAFWEALEE